MRTSSPVFASVTVPSEKVAFVAPPAGNQVTPLLRLVYH